MTAASMIASTFAGWEQISEIVKPRKPSLGAPAVRNSTRSPTPRVLANTAAASTSSTSRIKVLIVISLHLVDPDQVPEGVPDRAVADAVGLVDGLLDDVDL